MFEKVNPCRWGILSCAGIAKKNWRAIRQTGNATLVGVASRTPDTAAEFIAECQYWDPYPTQPRAFESYDAMLASEEIDAVYIPLPTALRAEWITKAARAGKHVLAEKPAALDANELEKALDACRENNVQYMDGVMFMHSARLPEIRKALDAGQLGRLKRITTNFSFCGDNDFRQNNIRSKAQYEPYGCVGDLGWYCARLALWTMNWEMPERVTGNLISTFCGNGSSGDVPSEFSSELYFANGVSASIYCSFETQHQQWAYLAGEEGFLQIRDFVLPFYGVESAYEISRNDFQVEGCNYDSVEQRQRYAVSEFANGRSNSQETNLFRNFSKLALEIAGGKRKPDPFWPEITVKTQKVLDQMIEASRA